MQRYILNSAVITAPGQYDYRLIETGEAVEWLAAGKYKSTIGYEETAMALEALTGFEIETYRVNIIMDPGDQALVFRLVLPRGSARPGADDKGYMGLDFIEDNCEIGILERLR